MIEGDTACVCTHVHFIDLKNTHQNITKVNTEYLSVNKCII